MATITVSPEVVSFLTSLKESTELRDGQGSVRGVFTPQAVTEEERLKSLFDLGEAEWVLEMQHSAGRPLHEIWQDLETQRVSG
jgi:hypothetical protein